MSVGYRLPMIGNQRIWQIADRLERSLSLGRRDPDKGKNFRVDGYDMYKVNIPGVGWFFTVYVYGIYSQPGPDVPSYQLNVNGMPLHRIIKPAEITHYLLPFIQRLENDLASRRVI